MAHYDKAINTEEKMIYEIVEDIIAIENKIALLSRDLDFNDNSGPGLVQFNLKHEITKNLSMINTLTNQKEEKNKELHRIKLKFQVEMEKIDDDIKEIEQKIHRLATSNYKEELYKLSYEKIEDIISKKKNEDDLKLISVEFEMIEKLLRNIILAKEEKTNKKNEIEEQLKMLKEEKLIVKENIINLISQKESFEEMIKLSAGNKSNTLNDNREIYNTFSLQNLNIDLYHYEICHINIVKVSMEIAEILTTFLSSILNTHDNFNCENEDNVNLSLSFTPLSNLQLIKTYINHILKKELSYFINLNQNYVTPYVISNFLSNLTNKIINSTSISNLFLAHSKICDFIKYQLKVNYYEKVIINEMDFIEKDYKNTKKELKKELDEHIIEVNKLNSKSEEIQMKLEQLKQKENILIKNKAKNSISLSPEEREYILLNEKSNSLINIKKQLQREYTEHGGSIELEINDLNRQLNEIDNKNKQYELGIEKINEEIKLKKDVTNDKIISYRRDINEKFKLIKVQLSLFKKKYGKNNMNLYNILVEKINNTLKNTSKSVLYHHRYTTSNSSLHSNFLQLSSSSISSYRQSIKKTTPNANSPLLNESYSMSSISLNSPRKVNNVLFNSKSLNKNQINTQKFNDLSYKHHYELLNKSRNISELYDNKRDNENNNIEVINTGTKSFQPNIMNINRNSNIQEFYYDNNYKKNIIDENEPNKLSFPMKNFIQKIECNNIDKEEAKSKIIPLLKNTFCYYRIMMNNNIKFNPLYHSDTIDLFNFVKVTIKLNEEISHLIIKNQNTIIEKIPLKEIDSTIISNNIKFIIKIFQKYKHKDYNMNMEGFLNSKDIKIIPLSYSDKVKATENQVFNFSLFLNNGEKLEFVVISYDDVKKWLNGLGYIVTHKDELLMIRNVLL